MMSNIRIYELAKRLELSNKEVLEVARSMGIAVKSHSSEVSQEEARKIKEEVASSRNRGVSSEIDGEEVKEEVKVICSQVGEEVVRRRGDLVVIRRRGERRKKRMSYASARKPTGKLNRLAKSHPQIAGKIQVNPDIVKLFPSYKNPLSGNIAKGKPTGTRRRSKDGKGSSVWAINIGIFESNRRRH